MATKYWKGGAQGIAQITTITFSAYTASQTYTITVNGKNVSYTAAASTASDVVTGLIAAIESAALSEFSALTASGTTSLILTGNNPGEPTTISASATGGITPTVTATVTATGPNHFGNPYNWIGDVAPVAADDLNFSDGQYSVLYDLDQSAVNYGDIEIESTFSGEIGLPVQNVNGYREYRPRSLKLGDGSSPFAITIGVGRGGQSSRINLDANGAKIIARVFGTGTASGEEPPVSLRNPGALSELDVYAGSVSVDADSSGALAKLRLTPADANSTSQVQVITSEAITVTDILLSGGSLQVLGAAGSIDASSNANARFLRDATCSSITVSGGAIVYWESTASISTALIVQTRGTIDFSRNGSPKSSAGNVCYAGGSILDTLGIVTWTGGILLSGCLLSEVTLDIGRGRTITL